MSETTAKAWRVKVHGLRGPTTSIYYGDAKDRGPTLPKGVVPISIEECDPDTKLPHESSAPMSPDSIVSIAWTIEEVKRTNRLILRVYGMGGPPADLIEGLSIDVDMMADMLKKHRAGRIEALVAVGADVEGLENAI